jgi:hypothetical protein
MAFAGMRERCGAYAPNIAVLAGNSQADRWGDVPVRDQYDLYQPLLLLTRLRHGNQISVVRTEGG